MKILFLTRSLASGGAERQLIALARGLSERGHAVIVAQFYGGGILSRDLENTDIRIFDLNKGSRWSNVFFFLRLYSMVRKAKPSIIHSYLGMPNIYCAILSKLFPHIRTVWGVRASDMDLSHYDWIVRLCYRIECIFSRCADMIIANSEAGRQYAVRNGFPALRMRVIHNGIDTVRFIPERNRGVHVRHEWGIEHSTRLVGIVARIDPMKDHETFLRAALLVRQQIPDCRFVCVGRCNDNTFLRLKKIVNELGLADAVIWAGERNDLPEVYNALDMLCLSSVSEGFPNVLAEAMACGLVCVSTDVGDAACIVGDIGMTVPPRHAAKLAEAIVKVLRCNQALPCSLARKRIEAQFSLTHFIETTERELLSLVARI